jgi:fido (protein-threonine AMPylation protein)
MFDPNIFIVESNKIDRQLDELGRLIPGEKPGDLMYDNQMRVLELFPHFISLDPIPQNLVPMIHRELTRGVTVLESMGNSGNYRTCGVMVGGEICPRPVIAQEIIRRILMPKIKEVRYGRYSNEEARQIAWWIHDVLEIAHPFVDGNGRTGRLLLNMVIEMLGHEKVIVFYNDRFKYYQRIQEFKMRELPHILNSLGS